MGKSLEKDAKTAVNKNLPWVIVILFLCTGAFFYGQHTSSKPVVTLEFYAIKNGRIVRPAPDSITAICDEISGTITLSFNRDYQWRIAQK